jgi:hypothetical protein
MSSESDRALFDQSVEPFDETVLFNERKVAYTVDSSSNGGQFSSQIQWNLHQLSSQANWVSLKDAYVQIPIRVKIKNAGASSVSSVSTDTTLTVLKNGFHNLIDSCQLVLDGSTVQTTQVFSNIHANFDILTTWSKDTYTKLGPVLGVELDNYTSLDNTAIATVIPATLGTDMTVSANTAIAKRQAVQNVSASAGSAYSILGTQAKNIGKSQVATVSAASVAAGAHCYTQFVLATIRLRDICPFARECPFIRNCKGFLYLNVNSSITTLTYDSGAALASVSSNMQYGRSCPVMLNSASAASQLAKASATWELTVEPSGIQTNQTGAVPQITYAKLVAPFVVPNPRVDSALSMKKTFRWTERNVSTFDIVANGTGTFTLTPGIANPTGVLLYPYFTGSSTVSNLLAAPLQSPFDAVPSTTSPFAALKDLQILVANKPVFNNPVNYDADMFLQEINTLGENGGEEDQLASGILSAMDWDRLYRYYFVNLRYRLDSEDGSAKSVIVQCTNATACNMRVIAFTLYEKEGTVDTSNGRIMMGRT